MATDHEEISFWLSVVWYRDCEYGVVTMNWKLSWTVALPSLLMFFIETLMVWSWNSAKRLEARSRNVRITSVRMGKKSR